MGTGTHQGLGAGTQAQDKSETQLEQASKALKDALVAGSSAATATELLRLLQMADASRVAIEISAFDALHGEHGSGVTIPVCADALQLVAEAPALIPLALLHAADVAMDVSKHRPPRRVPASQDPGRDPDGVGSRLVQLLQAGDAEAADGLMRGALWRKWASDVLEPWLFELNSAHFLGGGQGLVATVGAISLLRAGGFEHARRLLPGLVYALVRSSREDESEEWQWFRQRYSQLGTRLAELWQRQGKRALAEEERASIMRAVLDGSRDEAWHALIGALAAGASVESVIDLLARAACERLWRLDPAFLEDPEQKLSFARATQQVLYTRALRLTAPRHRDPTLLRLVLFGVHAIHQLKRFDQPAESWLAMDAKSRLSIADREMLLQELTDQIRARDVREAERLALAYLALGGPVVGLRTALVGLVLRDHYARADASGQALQLVAAACELAEQLPEADRAWPLRATIRLLASPLRVRNLEAVLAQARLALGAEAALKCPA